MSSEKRKQQKNQPQITYSRIFEEFAGSYVTIAVKSLKGDGGGKKVTNIMLAGYLLDECEDFYYIGESAAEIFAAVKKDDVATIMLGGEDHVTDIEIPEGSVEQ
jgi:hypothetical protein